MELLYKEHCESIDKLDLQICCYNSKVLKTQKILREHCDELETWWENFNECTNNLQMHIDELYNKGKEKYFKFKNELQSSMTTDVEEPLNNNENGNVQRKINENDLDAAAAITNDRQIDKSQVKDKKPHRHVGKGKRSQRSRIFIHHSRHHNHPKCPTFSGNTVEWKSFIETYKHVVHNKLRMHDGLKMRLLKRCLKGEAAQLINHIVPNAENYQECFYLLLKRYDSKRAIFGHLLDSILMLPKQHRENAIQLKKMCDTVPSCLIKIKSLNIDLSGWDPLLIYLLELKLNRNTLMAYEEQIADVEQLQSLNSFLEFIRERYMLLDAETRSNDIEDDSKSF